MGSEAGWAPTQYKSERGQRKRVEQRVEDFYDEDELEESKRTTLQVTVRWGVIHTANNPRRGITWELGGGKGCVPCMT